MKRVTFVLFCPTLVSFGETICHLGSRWQLPMAVIVPTNGFPESSTKGGAIPPRVGVDLQVKCIQFTARTPKLGCYLLSHLH